MKTKLFAQTALVSMLGLAALCSWVGQSAAADADLVVSDAIAGRTLVYGGSDWHLKADFDHLAIGNHAGTITLADGRMLIPDEVNKQLVVLQLGGEKPSIVARAPMPIPLGVRYAWTAVDPKATYFVATSDDDDEAVELLSIVNLKTYEAKQIKVDTKGPSDAEFGITIGGDPAMVMFHLGSQVEVYPLATLVDPTTKLDSLVSGKVKPVSTLAVGPGGHSTSYSLATHEWMGSTLRGLEIADVDGSALSHAATIPWDVDGHAGGRNARERLTADGLYEFGPLNPTMPDEKWADTPNDLHWVDLKARTATRVPLGPGVVGRAGVSARYAVYFNIGPNGDFAHLVDTAPASPTFRKVVADIPLPKLGKAPVPGKTLKGSESRYAGITPDGKWAFVSQGGDGKISVIDTDKRQVTATITTPVPLSGGGYLTAVAGGDAPFELTGR